MNKDTTTPSNKKTPGNGWAPSARPMVGELDSPQTFRAWLLAHARQDTAIGDVARDASWNSAPHRNGT